MQLEGETPLTLRAPFRALAHLSLALTLGCSGSDDSSVSEQLRAVIAPTAPTAATALECDLIDGAGASIDVGEVRWRVSEGAEFEGTRLAGAFTRGDEVSCEATPADARTGPVEAPPVTIVNARPVVSRVLLEPPRPRPGGEVRCVWEGFVDADGDPDMSTLAWRVNGQAADGGALLEVEIVRDDVVTCVVTPHDGVEAGVSVSATAIVGNAAPSIQDVRIVAPESDGETQWRCDWTGYADLDGDEDQTRVAWAVNGVPVNREPELAAAPSAGDLLTCTATPCDGIDDGSPVTRSVTVGHPVPKLRSVAISPSEPRAGDALECQWWGFEGEGEDQSWAEWVIDGEVVGQGPHLSEGYAFGTVVTCRVTPWDGLSEGQRVSAEVVVGNTPPTLKGAAIAPAHPTLGELMRCEAIGFEDVDGHDNQSEFTWLLGGEEVWHSPLFGMTPDVGERVTCQVTPYDGYDAGEPRRVSVVLGNDAPSLSHVEISPSAPVVTDDVTCTPVGFYDPEGGEDHTRIRWWINDSFAGQGAVLRDGFVLGDELTCEATPSDGESDGEPRVAEVTVANSVPRVVGVAIHPDAPRRNDELVCGWAIVDADVAQADQSTSQWFVDDQPAGTSETLARDFVGGEVVRCEVTAFDGVDVGETVVAEDVVVSNGAPSVEDVDITPAAARPDSVLTCVWTGWDDPDDDVDQSRVRWLVEGALVAEGPTTLAGVFTEGDDVTCEVEPFDGLLSGAAREDTVRILPALPVCGDGQVDDELDEACDDGVNDGAYDGCMPGCAARAGYCGDGDVNGLEVCDDGDNFGAYDGCMPGCAARAGYCGDGDVNGPEACDDGDNFGAYDGCMPGCAARAGYCGDGDVNGPEACDDGVNDGAYGGCVSGCLTRGGYCGDGDVSGPEACDDGTNDGAYGGCVPGCLARAGYCGDGDVNGDEVCDDGDNLGAYGGCLPGCAAEAERCGDGEVNGPEACDDGTNDGGYGGCMPGCAALAERCGDGVLNGPEVCDDGVNDGSYGSCKDTCLGLAERCGDGAVNGSEVCDDGVNDGSYGSCLGDCSALGPHCGDGDVTDGEICDDGANLGGYDGCQPGCQALGPFCGDGVTTDGEVCDDGDNGGGYAGCLSDCSGLERFCGDKVVDPEETCDDGYNVGGYGLCLPGCQALDRYCGDGLVDPEEACDNGENLGTYCQSDCQKVLGYCGDAVVQSAWEACDDGANKGGYGGCLPDCSGVERYCGDAVVDLEEACDDGVNDGSYGGCAADCSVVVTTLFKFGGWSDVVALGPKTDADGDYVTAGGGGSWDISDSDMLITVAWRPFSGAAPSGYHVLRELTDAGWDPATPYAVIVDPAERRFSDTDIEPGQTYFYKIVPLLDGTPYPTDEVFSVIRVVAPPANMALVHRWIANQEVCGLLPDANAATIDPTHHYRCAFSGQGSTDGYFDLGHDLLVDRFEAGCDMASMFTTYHSGSGVCDGWTGDLQTSDNPQLLVSSAALNPPAVRVDQARAAHICGLLDVNLALPDGQATLPKRLLSLKEHRAASAWPDELDDATIDAREAAVGGYSAGACNTHRAHDHSDEIHPDRDGVAADLFRTGSLEATAGCMSRYGLQDMVGNSQEWVSDQCEWSSGACVATGAVDPDNLDLDGYLNALGYNTLLTAAPFFSPALGLPLLAPEDGAWETATLGDAWFHGDYWDGHPDKPRGVLVGGGPNDTSGRGRWNADLDREPNHTEDVVGFRCAIPLASCVSHEDCPTGYCRDLGCVSSMCGDGLVSGTETCDDGTNSGEPGSCLPDCSAAAPDGVGWTDVVALGPKVTATGEYVRTDGLLSTDPADGDGRVTLAWAPFVGIAAGGYEVYRTEVPGTYDFDAPIATLATPDLRRVTDATTAAGRIYFYTVRPVVFGVPLPISAPWDEIRVVAPPANMALVHRWIANQAICRSLPAANADTIDPDNHYRCAYTGPGSRDGYFDLGHDLLVDRFELGCNTSDAGVSYDAATAECAVDGVPAASASDEQLGRLASPAAHLPPLGRLDQASAAAACQALTVPISTHLGIETLAQRLPSLEEHRALSVWEPVLDHATIGALEAGSSAWDTGYCNSNGAHGGSGASSDDALGVLPGHFRTGSDEATVACVSRFGVQDHVGNVAEWLSDQCAWSFQVCSATGAIDASNLDLDGYKAASWYDHGAGSADYFNPALGLPLAGAADGAWPSAALGAPFFHGDGWIGWLYGTLGAVAGGAPTLGDRAGRWAVGWADPGTMSYADLGARCVVAMPSCVSDSECASGSCVGQTCAPSCSDGVENQDETGVDCGGATCPACVVVTPSEASCLAWRDAGATDDGIYTIDPDGLGTNEPFDVYCNQTWQGGGWTLVFNHDAQSGFDPTRLGRTAKTCFDSTCTNRAFSTVPITSDVLIDASDSTMTDAAYGLRTTITGVYSAHIGGTLADAFGGGPTYLEREDNHNVDNDWQNGMSCGSTSEDAWGHWRDGVCTRDVITLNDSVSSSHYCHVSGTAWLGLSDTYAHGRSQCGGWDLAPNPSGINTWPDAFRFWVR